ncbi:MAG: MBL fold metallo-hydrolase [Bradymonadaceae bacterium]
MIERVWIFHCGTMSVPRPLVERGADFELARMPFLGALVEHRERGPILIDAPFGHEGPANFGRMSAGLLKTFGLEFLSSWSVAARLEQMGHRTSDIDDVLLTHLHGDHTGGLKTLGEATFHVSDIEWDFAREISSLSAMVNGYAPDDYTSLAPRVETFEMPPTLETAPEGLDLFGDGSIRAIGLPGHTIGHVGYRLTMADGRELFHVGDAVHSIDHIVDRREPGTFPRTFAHDITRMEESLRMLRLFRDDHSDISLISAHDFDWCETCLEGPHIVHEVSS